MEMPLYDSLRGNWNINRAIDDRHSGQQGIFKGIATFEPQGSSLIYTESGELTLGGTLLRATRTYIWSFDGSTVSVMYRDGSPFHSFEVKNSKSQAEHLCGQDIYYATYSFYLPDSWRVTWTVNGPKKDYTSTSEYRR